MFTVRRASCLRGNVNMNRFHLAIFLGLLSATDGYPVDRKVVNAENDFYALALLGISFFITTVVIVVACACCRRRSDGFKEFTNSTGSLTNIGFTNNLASELAIFPPPGVENRRTPPIQETPSHKQKHPTTKLANFCSSLPDISDWFIEPNGNFPRQQLFYQREIGKGWFGKVVEGEARGSKVVVKILREDATPEEKGYFLNEVKPFRDLRHRNVVKLFGRCLEHEPYLVLFEMHSNGDLKSFLVTNAGSRSAINEQGIFLRMMTDVSEGLNYMIENGFVHTDLAARNCLVSSDLTVKIGDYGTGIELYKDEYYIVENVAVPIRWCAPETVHCTPTTIETKQVTSAANIWSLGIVLWEIAVFGRLPYETLTDDQVIIRVFGGEKLRLPQPDCPYGHYLHNIMQLCWRVNDRPSISEVLSMLHYLRSYPTVQHSDFETRWNMTKPNTIPVIDNHTPIHSPRHTELAQRPLLQAKSEFDSGVDLEIRTTTDETPDSCRTGTPMTISPQLSVTSEEFFHTTAQKKSPSLTNLQGSLEDVSQFDSWLQGVEQKTEEDRKFVQNVSEAIKNLDETLAMEKTSSSSQESSMECSKTHAADFRLGPLDVERKSDSSSSDTEDETWRHRIERGEFTEKVKEKSKSVTDLMVLTHIDSEGSETDSLPSLTRQYSIKKNGNKTTTFTSIGFGSEGNIRNAVLGEELQEKLRQLSLWKTDEQTFLGKAASEMNKSKLNQIGKHVSDDKNKSMGDADFRLDIVNTPFVNNLNSDTFSNETSNLLHSCKNDINSSLTNFNKILSGSENRISCIGGESGSICTEDRIVGVEINKESVKNLCSETVKDVSSHDNVINTVPDIIVTESNIPDEYSEPEVNIDIQHLYKKKPRKLVFVCHDTDESNESDLTGSCSSPNDSIHSNSDITEVTYVPPNKAVRSDIERHNESSVIIGSCEEYTLDYFKGLKTTFVPSESYSDDDGDNSGKLQCIKKENLTEDIPPDLESPSSTKGLIMFDEIVDSEITDATTSCLERSNERFPESQEVHLVENFNEDLGTTLKIESDTHSSENVESPSIEITESSASTEVCLSDFKVDFPSLQTNAIKKYHETDPNTVEEFRLSQETHLNNISEELLIETEDPSHNIDSCILQDEYFSNIQQQALNERNVLECSVNLARETVPKKMNNVSSEFKMNEIITEVYSKQSNNYDTYFSIDSGHSSDRCSDQDHQMNDLKTRLEDVANSSEDFQLKRSEDEYGGKLHTPDDERSSDSGFRDKGSLSESVEDTCDEKYNLEDIDAELDDFNIKNSEKEDFKYYEQLGNESDLDKTAPQCLEGWFLHPQRCSPVSEKENGWLSVSTEDEVKPRVSIDDEYVAAIRNELKEKLPCAQQVQKIDEDTSPEQEKVDTVVQFSYPAQLSPILEEQESNQSSLILDDESPIFHLEQPILTQDTFKEDIIKALDYTDTPEKDSLIVEDLEGGNEVVFSCEQLSTEDDVLIVDTETNKVTLIESPKPQSHLAFVGSRRLNENFKDESDEDDCDDSIGINSETYNLSSDNVPLTPDISFGSNTFSSPENGVLSGFYLSPCSIRSDLFDSGPPSLPFDLGQSIDEVEEISLGKPNNEAVEIEQDLVNIGILKNEKNSDDSNEGILSAIHSDTSPSENQLSPEEAAESDFIDHKIYFHEDVLPDDEHNTNVQVQSDAEDYQKTETDLIFDTASCKQEEDGPVSIIDSFFPVEVTQCNSKTEKVEENIDDFWFQDPVWSKKILSNKMEEFNPAKPMLEPLKSEKENPPLIIIEETPGEDNTDCYDVEDPIILNYNDITGLNKQQNDFDPIFKSKVINDFDAFDDFNYFVNKNDLQQNVSDFREDSKMTRKNEPESVSSNTIFHSNIYQTDESLINFDETLSDTDKCNHFEQTAPGCRDSGYLSIINTDECTESSVKENYNNLGNSPPGITIDTKHSLDRRKQVSMSLPEVNAKQNESELLTTSDSTAPIVVITQYEEGTSESKNFNDGYLDGLETDSNTVINCGSSIIESKQTIVVDVLETGLKGTYDTIKEEKDQISSSHVCSLMSKAKESVDSDQILSLELMPKEERPSNTSVEEQDPVIPEGLKAVSSYKKKQVITSTLALMSPDLSLSTDSSKSHSLLSSFSSTPTCDDKKFVQDKASTSMSNEIDGILESQVSTVVSEASTNVPLPSPEDADKGWRPTIGQLLELTDQMEGEEMTTSFIEPDEQGIYTPDWESDTSDEQSSSSSEFIWKPQESLTMERIDEEEEEKPDGGSDSEEDEDDDDDEEEEEEEEDDDFSEGSATEFIPSTWDSTAVPTKSALKNPNSSVRSAKKKVLFKKEKYQCVYEYPRELSDDEEDDSETWQTPRCPYSYDVLAEWVFGESELPPTSEGDSDSEEVKNPKRGNQDSDFYRLDYNIGSHFLLDEGEFYIGGSGGEGSEFFPGQLSECDDLSLEFVPSASDLTGVKDESRSGSSSGSSLAGLGELRHTKDQLRLELPSIRPDKGEACILDSGIDTSSA